MVNLVERVRNKIEEVIEHYSDRGGPVDFVVGEYKKNGGVILGAEGEPYRLKVTPDKMEIICQDGGQLARTDPEAEIIKVQEWGQGYSIQAMLLQRYLRVGLGLPADIPEEHEPTRTP